MTILTSSLRTLYICTSSNYPLIWRGYVYKLFEDQDQLNLDELKKLHPKRLETGTLDNTLRELRSVGLIRKVGDNFQRNLLEIPATEDGFRDYMSQKFMRYTPYQKLRELSNQNISVVEVVSTLKDIFRGTSYAEKTWSTYAKHLIGWFDFANLDIKDRFIGIEKVRKVGGHLKPYFIPNRSPKTDISVFCDLKDQSKPKNHSKIYHSLYDLKSIGLIEYMDKTIYLTKKGKLIQSKLETKEFEELIAIEAMKTEKIKQATKYFLKHPTCSRREFREALSSTLLNNRKTEESMRAAIYALYAWAKFIYDHLDESKLDSVSN